MEAKQAALTRDELRSIVRQRLRAAGFTGRKHLVPGHSKEQYRLVHAQARRHELRRRLPRIKQMWKVHGHWFAGGAQVHPERIQPRLQIIRPDEEWNDLFWLARMTWSLPYSQGYGRRIRCLIWDDNSRSLMGIAGLQSPPLDFPLRDEALGFHGKRKTALVNQMMDAYVVGAIPPFNDLLGGKLAALALASDEVRKLYERRYRGRITLMKGREIPARLLGFTTTSAFGSSSQYDRINGPDGNRIYQELGTIEDSHGSYHFNGLYHMLRDYLQEHGLKRQWTGYGTGPRVRWQVIRQGLRALDLPQDLVVHHVPRVVYLVETATNIRDLATGEAINARWRSRPFALLQQHWTQRWMKPRWTRIMQDTDRAKRLSQFDPDIILHDLLRSASFR